MRRISSLIFAAAFTRCMIFVFLSNGKRRSQKIVTFSKVGRHGRLGNQLFQIAATVGIAERHGFGWKFPAHIRNCSAGKLFNLHGTDELAATASFEYYEQSSVYYELSLPSFSDDVLYDLTGHFQSYRYFMHSTAVLANIFLYPSDIAREVTRRYPEINSGRTVTMHVRRSDYVSHNYMYNLLDFQYYKEGLRRLGDTDVIIFVSDDIEWCKRVLSPQLEQVKHAFIFSDIGDELHEFVLMLMSPKLIIANSSFSWWAAYLKHIYQRGAFHGKEFQVVAPVTWFNKTGPLADRNTDDLRPPGWILVQN